MNGFAAWVQQLDFTPLIEMLLVVIASVLSVTVHETCHGLAAYRMGDPTAKWAGRLTLNPLRHIDLMGLVLLAVARFGWAKPVPVNPRYFKKPKLGMAVTALAGPVSNVLLAFAALLVRSVLLFVSLRTGGGAVLDYVILLTVYLAVINSGLAIFNLLPVPPLDGSKVLFAVLPQELWRRLMRYERYGMVLLAVLLLTGLLDTPLHFLRTGLLDGLQWLASFPFYLLLKCFP